MNRFGGFNKQGKDAVIMKSMTVGIGLLAGCLWAAAHGAGEAAHDGDQAGAAKTAPAPEKAITLQTTCPAMGGAINKNLYVDHDGKRVYICCKGCEAPLKKDPAKYIKQLEDAGVTVATLQTTCPVLGGAMDKTLYVDHAGKRIYVCCKECIAKVKADPAKFITSMEAAGVALDAAPKNPAEKTADPKSEAKGHEEHQH